MAKITPDERVEIGKLFNTVSCARMLIDAALEKQDYEKARYWDIERSARVVLLSEKHGIPMPAYDISLDALAANNGEVVTSGTLTLSAFRKERAA